MKKRSPSPVGAPAESLHDGDMRWRDLLPLENAAVPEEIPGWHTGYDPKAEAAWLWNDDPASEHYLTFYTYENAASLNAKLNYIRDHHLGGLIVWEVQGDSPDADWPMITQIHRALHRNNT